MRLSSPAFDDGARIPERHTADGEDVSPELAWTEPPAGTVEFALVVDDPDAPRPEPWVHWLLYGIPADVRSLKEGVPRERRPGAPPGAAQGRNSWESDALGYRGPAPPAGHGRHRYRFTLQALDAELGLEPGARVDELRAAMKGHVLEETTLTGTYER